MAHRTFTSPDGIEWQVWFVPGPGAGGASGSDGWLCFESAGGEKRRLAPVPVRWVERGAAELWLYCRVAEPAGARGGRRAAVGAPAGG